MKLNLIKTALANSSGNTTDLGSALTDFPGTGSTVGSILTNVYTLAIKLGAIAVFIFLIWGAFEWLTAGGDSDKVSKAQKKITTSIIGLFVLLAVWALWRLALQFTGLQEMVQS